MSAFLFLSALVACSLAAQQLQCNFEMRQPSMPNAFVTGTLKYDFTNKKLLHTFTTSGQKELYSFNTNGGFTQTSSQYRYTFSASCGCAIESVPFSMPIYFLSTQYLNPSVADGTTLNTPVSSGNGLKNVVFTGDFPISSEWTDGRKFTYTGCTSASFAVGEAEFVQPADCKCGKPIDIVVVLDRSSSISTSEFVLEKQFTQNLVNSFEYSPLGVNLGITNFHTITWDGPVSLAQGNNPDSVKNGADALQCAPDAQCKIFSTTNGACCGSGTSISSGIVNGADMLAAVPNTGFRKDAAKVLIVLTDGYHNKVLKMQDGAILRDGSGKPSGTPYVVNGKTCTEGGEAACKAGLLADLDYSVAYAVKKIPTVNIIAVGVGAVWSQEQLLHIANNKASNVFGTDSWEKLSGLVDDLVSVTCQQSPATAACATCCGFCACNACVAPDGCDSGNFCDTISLAGTCCTAVAKPPSTCDDPTNKCKTYSCDRNAKNGAGGCTSVDKPLKEDTACADYSCDPLTGETTFVDLCPPKCYNDTQCADTNACTIDTCLMPGTKTASCQVTTRTDCENPADKCFTYGCDPATGCTKTAKPLPANTACAQYTCDPATGDTVFTDLCPSIPECADASGCNDQNACTDESCVPEKPGDATTNKCIFTPKPANFCDQADLCFTYACDPAVGCVKTAKPLPANTSCAQYTCNPATGETVFTDLCPPQPACVAPTDCDDKNACTTDECVLEVEGDPLSAKCVWTHFTEDACDDDNACTYDYCVPESGCKNDPFPANFCDDNNACTVDICDPLSANLTFPCVYTDVKCNDTDICHESYCEPSYGCLVVDIICPTTDNCTISGCNVTDDEGCYVESAGTCGFPVGAIAGIAAGVVAGIVLAALAGALIVGGGTAYAFTQGAGSGLGATVSNNPIFTPGGERGYNPLHKA